ncbi:MAG: glycosyltransferase family 4 protein [Gemmatimonadota bacterium]
MRILVVNWQDLANPQAGGAEIHVHEIFERLAARGHQVTLLVSGWPGCEKEAVSSGVRVVRVGGRYTFPLHALRGYDSICSGGSAGFDVVVEDINKVPLFTPRWGSVPVVLVVPHLFGSTAFKQEAMPVAAAVWLAERAMPSMYRDSPVLVISQGTAEDLVQRGFNRARITVSPPGVDHELYKPGDAEGGGRFENPTLVYVGRLRKYKGLDTVIRAVARLEREGNPVRLKIVGKGNYRARLERLAARSGAGHQIEFLGYVQDDEKIQLLQRAWANVYPSPKEGWGITNVEAAACGTPSIASDSPGLRESVSPGRSGFLVPHADVDAWTATIRDLVNSEESERFKLSATCREHAARFDWDRAATEMEAVLTAALANRRP